MEYKQSINNQQSTISNQQPYLLVVVVVVVVVAVVVVVGKMATIECMTLSLSNRQQGRMIVIVIVMIIQCEIVICDDSSNNNASKNTSNRLSTGQETMLLHWQFFLSSDLQSARPFKLHGAYGCKQTCKWSRCQVSAKFWWSLSRDSSLGQGK